MRKQTAAIDTPYTRAIAATLLELVVCIRALSHTDHPARPVGNLNELVISKGRTGYVALYRYLPEQDRMDILSIRHQRESGLIE